MENRNKLTPEERRELLQQREYCAFPLTLLTMGLTLTDEQLGRFSRMIYTYVINGENDEIPQEFSFVWYMIKKELDKGITAYLNGKNRGPQENNTRANKGGKLTDDQAEELTTSIKSLGVDIKTAALYVKQIRKNNGSGSFTVLKREINKAKKEYEATPQYCIERATEKGDDNRGFYAVMAKFYNGNQP